MTLLNLLREVSSIIYWDLTSLLIFNRRTPSNCREALLRALTYTSMRKLVCLRTVKIVGDEVIRSQVLGFELSLMTMNSCEDTIQVMDAVHRLNGGGF